MPYWLNTRATSAADRAQRPVDDRDLLPGHPIAEEAEDFARDELGLGAVAAGLEQADGRAGIESLGRRLEQLALKVVQGGAGRRVVVIVTGRKLLDLVGERSELGHRPRPGPGARHARPRR